jgi:hypothetical protein
MTIVDWQTTYVQNVERSVRWVKRLIEPDRPIPQSEWLAKTEDPQEKARRTTRPSVSVSDPVHGLRTVPDSSWTPIAPTYAGGRSQLSVLAHYGIVEYLHNPDNPKDPLVRLKRDDELESLKQRLSEPRPEILTVFDLDGKAHKIPADRVHEFDQQQIDEKVRRWRQKERARLGLPEEETIQ